MGVAGTGTTPSNQYYQISGGSTGASNYYDTNGNLKNDVTHTYTWDADGNMLSTDGSTVTMMYDALDRMIEQTRGSSHAEIVYGPYGLKLALMNGQTLVNAFVKLPGGSRAVYNSSGLAYYRHGDHLGSSRLATTTTRTKYYDVAYAPYGEDYNGSGTTPDLAFTDENQDTVGGGWATNLYDFMLREYRTAHGRWTSPDPAGLGAVDPTNPQTWNRYAYVINNPMALVDMLGLDDACYDEDGNPMECDFGDPFGGSGNGVFAGPGGQSPGGGTCVGVPNATNKSWCNEAGGTWTGCGQTCNNLDPYAGQYCTPGGVTNCNPPQGPPQVPGGCPPGASCSNGSGGGAANNGPQQQPQQTKKQPWYCGSGNSWSHPFTAPTGRQWGQMAVADAATAYGFAKYLGPVNPVSDVFTVSSLVEGWGWATCD